MMSSSRAYLSQAMPFNTLQGGGVSIPGIEVAQAPRTLYPCNDQPVSLHPYINDIRGHQFGCSPPCFKKKKESLPDTIQFVTSLS